MNKQELASKIWASANKMRSKIEAAKYKDYILGFIFYKFLSEKEVNHLLENGREKEELKELNSLEDKERDFISRSLGYFISYDNLFQTWIEKKEDFNVGDVTDALSAFDRLIDERYKNVFKGIFHTLETEINDLGDTAGAKTKAIKDLIYLIKDIPMDNKQDYDVLGFIYEYLISNFAANAGKKAGEFYTPFEVSLLMSEIISHDLKDRENIEIYDSTSGSGSLLINIGKCFYKETNKKNNVKYYAQELIESTYNLTRMNLIMRGIEPSNIDTRCGDSLGKDWPIDETNGFKGLQLDAVVSNPPYSNSWDPENHNGDPRFSEYGYAPSSKADYAFLLHDLYHLKDDGIMTIVLPHGVLFRGGSEEEIREKLIESDNIETIIGLPANIFFGTGIPTIIIILRKKRQKSDVLFIDASKHFLKDGKKNRLQASDIKRIYDCVIERKNDSKYEKFARLVSKDEIRKNNYNLNIPRYVDSSEEKGVSDLYALMYGGIPTIEIDELNNYFNLFPTLKGELFTKNDDKPYATLKVEKENLKEIINDNIDVKNYYQNFVSSFSTFKDFTYDLLISDLEDSSKDISHLESIISNDIFNRLENFLIDKYDSYQILDNHYKVILQDLEIIKNDGVSSINDVLPNMVIKKKDKQEVEVQEGFIGKIIPFEVIQNVYFKEDLDEKISSNLRLEEINSEINSIFEELNETQKEENFVNEEKDAFIISEITKYLKSMKNKKDLDDETKELIDKLTKVNGLNIETKEIKKALKTLDSKLENETINKIKSLSLKEAKELLKIKWIGPLYNDLVALYERFIDSFTIKIKKLINKYNINVLDLEKEIKKTEKELSSMLEDLTGDNFDMKAIDGLKKLLEGD